MRRTIIALVDCVSFYANVERQFHAALENRPVIVLSHNDGNIVSLSTEARTLGLKRGMAYHECRSLIRQHGVAVFSSNFALYHDVSDRIMALLADFALVRDGIIQQERYSIDECFLDLSHVADEHLLDVGHRMQAAVLQATGINVRIGIAPTKILAKVAAEIAKREPIRGDVVSLAGLSEQELDGILETMAVEDIWTIGRRRAQVLEAQEIFTAEILKYTPPGRGRYLLGVTGERIVYELRGLSCIPLETASKPRQGILVSRSFGRPIQDQQELAEAIAHYTALAAIKLRRQESVADLLSLFISTNRFDTEAIAYAKGASQHLPFAMDFTPDLIAVAHALLQQMYRPGIRYHRAGVYLAEIGPRHVIQPDLFGDYDFEQEAKKARLMATLDIITAFCGRDAVFFGAQGITRPWQSRATRRSAAYTTRWSDILIVSAR
jgi:DNA polymerase V